MVFIIHINLVKMWESLSITQEKTETGRVNEIENQET